MPADEPSKKVQSRNQQFTTKLKTKITKDIAPDGNPFLTDEFRFHGYEHFDLVRNCEFSDLIFLLHKGDLPSGHEKKMFTFLCNCFINPGPRSPAVQAGIIAGVGKTATVSILPASLSIYGGEFEGAANVEGCIRFLRKSRSWDFEKLVSFIIEDESSVPGFGRIYGDKDCYAGKMIKFFSESFDTPLVSRVAELNERISVENIGVLKSGVFAAVLADLGFQPRYGNVLYQLVGAPGISAHSLEYANKPITEYFFESDEKYCYSEEPNEK